MHNLKVLADNRDEILKAEFVILLHDVGKLHVGHQSKYLRDKPRSNYAHTRFGPGRSSSFLQQFANNFPSNTSISAQRVIQDHHKRSSGNCGVNDFMVCVVQRMDWLDSEYDRSEIITHGRNAFSVQPKSLGFGVFSVFGYQRFLYCLNSSCSNSNIKPLPENARNKQVNCSTNGDFLTRLVCALKDIAFANFVGERMGLLVLLQSSLAMAAGDTRYSVNDISLWEHSLSVGVLFKIFYAWIKGNDINLSSPISAISVTSLEEIIKKHAQFRSWFRPQLLPLRIDGLAYLAQSNNVPDLLARRALLQKVYDAWQDILEWEFPLAGEVYRDENGPVFLTFLRDQEGKNVIPLHLLKLPEDNKDFMLLDAYQRAKNLEEYLRQTVIHFTHGDLTLPPEIELSTYTQKRSEDGKSLGDLLREEQEEGLRYQPDVEKIAQSWNNEGELHEKCSLCGLRPLGFGAKNQNRHKAISRGMCGVCLERRESRAKPWVQGIHLDTQKRFLQGHPETVWLDEVADKHGRIALIVGYFPLENWLDGTLVESLAMFKRLQSEFPPINRKIVIHEENGQQIDVVLGPKPISYSRIRRIWETTRRFWQDVAPTDPPPKALQEWLEDNEYGLSLGDLWESSLSLEESLAGQTIGERRPRIFLKGAVEPKDRIFPYHAYELEIQGRKVAVLWVPEKDGEVDIPEKYRGGFWVIENLEYLDNVYGRSFQNLVQDLAGQPLKVYEPTEYGRPGQEQATFTIAREDGVQDSASSYTPLIPILAEPRTFMALVPADKAFEVVKAIKAKYEREMGKVRNRLPLHIGVVYAYRKMPLRAIMDAGRRMLAQQSKPLVWKVICSARKSINKEDKLPERFDQDKDGQFIEWLEILIEADDRKLTWYVPALMGDGETEDHWYPYVFLAQCEEPSDRNRYYKAINPWNSAHPWLVHVAKLEPGDEIYFTPATFDFEFLETNVRRFEVHYDERGKRYNSLTRPYLLDEIIELEKIWNFVAREKKNGKSRLSSSQIFAIRNAIEAKREEWFENFQDSINDESFKEFCKALFINAQWQGDKPTLKEINWLTDMAVRGYFTDAIYLFHHIMKEKIEDVSQEVRHV